MEKHDEIELDHIWSKEAQSYKPIAESNPDYLAHFQIIEETLGNLAGKKVVDVGCGTGITSAYLASKGASLYLIDISQAALDFTRKYFQSKKLKAKYFKQNAFKMNFPEKYFDVVWNGGVIEHFDDEDKVNMMKRMWKITKPKGTLLISAPNALDFPFMVAKQLLVSRKKWAFGEEDDLTEKRLVSLAKSAGITNISTFAYNPIVGWWFFPYGREITNLLGLNTVRMHKIKSVLGHNIILRAIKN